MNPAQSVRPDFLAGIALVVAVLASYLPVTRAGFIWDDDDYVTQNQTLRTAGGLAKIWFDPKATPQYYPLVHTSFWLEYRIWRLKAVGYHLTNVALHALAAVLLWRVLRALNLPGAWAAACVFAVHPVHVESVAWITERKNVLSLVFYLSALLVYLRSDSNRRLYVASLILFVCALLSKSVACSLPAAIALILWWKRGRVSRSDWLRLAPMFAIGLAMGLVTAWLEKVHVGADGKEWSLTLAQRILIAGRAVWFYAGKLVWPSRLTFIYPRWAIDAASMAQWLFPVFAVALVGALWALRHRIGRGPLVAVLLFGGTLLPALGFIDVYPMRYSFVADHFQYAASISLIALLVAVGARALPGRTGAAAACVFAVVLGVLTWRQCSAYHDLRSLWEDTLAKNPDCWMAENNLAVCLLNEKDFAGAERHARRALQIHPDHAEGHNALGVIMARQGRRDEAERYYAEALRIKPRLAAAHINWGVMLARSERLPEAREHLLTAVELRPRNIDAVYNLAAVSMAMDRHADAEMYFRRTIDLAPEHLRAHTGLATLLAAQGRVADARAIARRAIDIAQSTGHPDQADEIDQWQRSLAGADTADALR